MKKERPIETTPERKERQIKALDLQREAEYYESLNTNDRELFGFRPGTYGKGCVA